MKMIKRALCLLLSAVLAFSCVSAAAAGSDSLTARIKRDYKAILREHPDVDFIWITYAIYDIDKNGVPELLLRNGTCEMDFMYEIYTHDGSKAVYLGETFGGHASLHEIPDRNGVYVHYGHMGSECINTVRILNGKVVVQEGEWRDIGDGEYTKLGGYILELRTAETTLVDQIKTKAVAAPTDLKAAANKTTAVKLRWTKVPEAKGYVVYQYDAAKNAFQKLGKTGKTSYTVKGLASGTKLQFAVKSYKSVNGTVKYSVLTLPLQTATRPQAPTLQAKDSAYGVMLSWNKVPGASGYIVYYGGEDGKSYEKILKTQTTSFLLWEDVEHDAYYKAYAYIEVDGKTIKSVSSEPVLVKAFR